MEGYICPGSEAVGGSRLQDLVTSGRQLLAGTADEQRQMRGRGVVRKRYLKRTMGPSDRCYESFRSRKVYDLSRAPMPWRP